MRAYSYETGSDGEILREFTDAIKGGYSGRIVRILKILAAFYRGGGRTKYAHETLHLLHQLTHIWPAPLRYARRSVFEWGKLVNARHRTVMQNNWLVNPTGKANS